MIASMSEVLAFVRDLVFAAAALGGLIVAAMGLSTWRKQLKGQHVYDTATRLLRAALKVRGAIEFVRQPFMTGAEQVRALEELGQAEPADTDKKTPSRGVAAAYQVRWNRVMDATVELDTAALEAEVLWGSGVVGPKLKDLRQAVVKLKVALGGYLRDEQRKEEGSKRILSEEKWHEYHGILFGYGDEGADGNDTCSRLIASGVGAIEDWIRPLLRR